MQETALNGLTGNALVEIPIMRITNECLQSLGYYEATPTNQNVNEQQKSIEARYVKAVAKMNEKMAPIQEYIINTCRPKEDKEYVACLNGKNDERIEANFFPDLAKKYLNAQKESEQQLVRKEITRKEFKEISNKLGDEMTKEMKERGEKDIKSGIYTGKY
jgi:hypothetical protein